MNNDLKWYALYTRPFRERKVAQILDVKQVENYCPLQKIQRSWSDRKKIIQEPLFKCYVFVHIEIKNKLPVVQTDGVLNFVTCQGKASAIRDEEIEMIKNFLSDHQHVRLEKMNFVKDEQVRIMSGPLYKQTGTIMYSKGKTVKILLPTLGFAMVAEIDKSNIERFIPAESSRLKEQFARV